jgi:hypothetical protein
MTRALVCGLIVSMLATSATLGATQSANGTGTTQLRVGRTVTLVLTDGTRVKGKIAETSTDSVTIGPKNAVARTVPLDSIAGIRTGIPRWAKIAIGASAVYVVLVLLVIASGGFVDAI